MGLLQTLKPKWWFAAHLHTRFEATVSHQISNTEPMRPQLVNPDEIGIDEEDFADLAPPTTSNPEEIIIDVDEELDSTNPASLKNSATSSSVYPKANNPDEITIDEEEIIDTSPATARNPDEIALEDEENDVVAAPIPQISPSSFSTSSETRFLALDKCLPKRRFLEVRLGIFCREYIIYSLRSLTTLHLCRLRNVPL